MDGRLTAGLALGLGLAAVSVAGEVTVFPHPRAIESSPDYRVEVEGQEVFCYRDYRLDTDFPPSLFDMRVSPQAYAIFDFTGTVRVRVTVLSDLINSLDALEIRPLTAGIRARVAERTVEFVLDRPGDVTVDPQGTGLCVLHLFTNAPETDVPSPTDPDVIYCMTSTTWSCVRATPCTWRAVRCSDRARRPCGVRIRSLTTRGAPTTPRCSVFGPRVRVSGSAVVV
jgi:hypothetical protein